MRDEFWLEDQSPDLFDIEDDQTPDSFGAFSNVLRGPEGPPGPPGPQGERGADGTVSFDELTPAQKESLRGEGVPAGGTTGQVLAKASNTDYATEWIDAGGGASMTILSYGHSTWADFIAAYQANSIVYCRASISADPSAGSQVRMAYMAYVNHPTVPTSVEFQYYRSMTSHSDDQQGDQIFIYTLTNTGAWTSSSRRAFTKIEAGTNMSSSYANGTLTLNATGGGGGTSDYDDLTNQPSINNVTLSGNKTAADLGLGTYSKPSGGIPQTDLASAVQSKLDNTVVVSDTQPTATENKLWVDTDAGAGTSYQVPTVAEMEAADNAILGNLATIESSQATAAHAVGEYIVYNGQLYKVTATTISQGQMLNPGQGGNIAAVNLGDAVKLLYDKDKTYRVTTGINGINVFIKGNAVMLSVTGFRFTATSRGWYQITTIPSIACPTTFTVFAGCDNIADNTLLQCRVDTNGSFFVYAYAAVTYELRANAFYFTSEDGTI